MIKVTCYGTAQHFSDLDEAKAFFIEAVMSTEGSQRDRYINILMQLEDGLTECSDEY